MQVLFQLIQTLYWAGLSTWFGTALFIAIAAPVIFRVVREHDPTLPEVLSVNLDAQHSTLLASTIVARLMQTTTRVGLWCGGLVLLGLAGQALLLPAVGQTLLLLVVRISLFFFAAGVLIYDWRVVAPKLFYYRQQYIDEADNPDVANAAQDQFERLSRESMNVLFVQTVLLLGLILFSANVTYTPLLRGT